MHSETNFESPMELSTKIADHIESLSVTKFVVSSQVCGQMVSVSVTGLIISSLMIKLGARVCSRFFACQDKRGCIEDGYGVGNQKYSCLEIETVFGRGLF